MVDKVKNYLKKFNRENDIILLSESTATVELAAKALNTLPAVICKTMAFKGNDSIILLMTAGDAKIDNQKFREKFNVKCKMIQSNEVEALVGYPPGGVCGFDNPDNVKKYCDVSLKRFSYIFPACGTANSAIKLSCDELFQLCNSIEWVDICKAWDPKLSN